MNNAGIKAQWWRGATLLKVITFVGLAIHFLLVFRPDESFLSRPFQEDAFYSLSVARSLGAGTGITIDGVNPTNGVQPLICFLYAPIFALTDDITTALRLVMLLQALLFTGAVFAVAWFAVSLLKREEWKREIFWLTTALIAWSYMLSNGMLNGLETGLAILMIYGSLAYYNVKIASAASPGLGRFIILGALLGLAVLTRIDTAFLVAAILLWHLIRAHIRYGSSPWSERLPALKRTLIECMLVGVMSIVVSAPWWIYNQTVFGSLLPISGQAQQMLFKDPLNSLGYAAMALADSIMVMVTTPVEYQRYLPVLGPVALIALVALLILATRSSALVRRSVAAWRSSWNITGAVPLLLFGLALLVYYIFFFGAPHFLVRYLLPLRVLIVLGVIGLVHALWKEAPVGGMLRGGLALIAAALLGVSIYGMRWNFVDHFTNLYQFPARWIVEHVKEGEKVGMFQSGTTGFLRPRTVVNLDGKVNVGALRALQQGRIASYVDSMRFDYLIDWAPYMRPVLDDPAVGRRYRAIDTLVGEFVVWKREE